MWMKIDDGLHAHRKTRAVTKSHPKKRRDAAPLGLWVAAGSWAAQNRTDGWVPADELDRWDEDWEALVARLVSAGYWWPAEREGEPGYGFNDWLDYNPESEAASRSGSFGNHVRWHEHKGIVNPECDHCPKEPDNPESAPHDDPESGGDIGGRSGGESPWESRSIALPQPDPTRTRPEPEQKPSADKSAPPEGVDRFEEFWNAYGHKVKRADAERKWRIALKKPGVTADLLISAAASYVAWERANNEGGRFIAHPSTWLHGERWRDERVVPPQPQGRAAQWLQLAADLGPEPPSNVREIGGGR